MLKRSISIILCLAMLLTMLPVNALAMEEIIPTEAVEAAVETEAEEETTLPTEAEPAEEMTAPKADDTEPAEKSSEPEETEPVTIESPMETEPIEENIITEEIPLQESGSTVVKSGTCGTGVTWTLDDEGILTISGSGAMKNYQAGSAPWRYNDPNHVVIEDGVTSIGKYAFYEMDSLESVFVGAGVASIGSKAFSECSNLEQIDVSEKNSVYSSI